jgi:hypothetical protein
LTGFCILCFSYTHNEFLEDNSNENSGDSDVHDEDGDNSSEDSGDRDADDGDDGDSNRDGQNDENDIDIYL